MTPSRPDLRLLDPADHGAVDRAGTATAQRTLEHVLSVPRRPEDQEQPAGRRPATRRWAAAAAAVGAGAVVLPSVLGGSGAYASWTPAPTPVPPAEAAALQADCLEAGRLLGQGGAVTSATSERRGDFVFSLVATTTALGSCLVLDAASPTDDEREERAANLWGPREDLPAPGPDGTSVLWGGTSRTGAGTWTSAVGRVGDDVVAVEVTDDDGLRVQTRVAQGHFTAWWPGTPGDRLTVAVRTADGTRSTRTLRAGEH